MSHMAVFHYLRGAQVIKCLLDSVVSPPTVRMLFHPSHETLSLPVLNTLKCMFTSHRLYNESAKKEKNN